MEKIIPWNKGSGNIILNIQSSTISITSDNNDLAEDRIQDIVIGNNEINQTITLTIVLYKNSSEISITFKANVSYANVYCYYTDSTGTSKNVTAYGTTAQTVNIPQNGSFIISTTSNYPYKLRLTQWSNRSTSEKLSLTAVNSTVLVANYETYVKDVEYLETDNSCIKTIDSTKYNVLRNPCVYMHIKDCGGSSLGLAIYNNYLFYFQTTTSVSVKNITDISFSTPAVGLNLKLYGPIPNISNSNRHGSLTFGPYKFNEDDEFPALYVSCNSGVKFSTLTDVEYPTSWNRTNANYYTLIFVFRVVRSGNTFTYEHKQTINCASYGSTYIWVAFDGIQMYTTDGYGLNVISKIPELTETVAYFDTMGNKSLDSTTGYYYYKLQVLPIIDMMELAMTTSPKGARNEIGYYQDGLIKNGIFYGAYGSPLAGEDSSKRYGIVAFDIANKRTILDYRFYNLCTFSQSMYNGSITGVAKSNYLEPEALHIIDNKLCIGGRYSLYYIIDIVT